MRTANHFFPERKWLMEPKRWLSMGAAWRKLWIWATVNPGDSAGRALEQEGTQISLFSHCGCAHWPMRKKACSWRSRNSAYFGTDWAGEGGAKFWRGNTGWTVNSTVSELIVGPVWGNRSQFIRAGLVIEIWNKNYGMFNLGEKTEYLLNIYYVLGTVLGLFICCLIYSSR